jgi:hypothetical protein
MLVVLDKQESLQVEDHMLVVHNHNRVEHNLVRQRWHCFA